MVTDEVTIIVGPDSAERALAEMPLLNRTHLQPTPNPNVQVFIGGRSQRPYLLRAPFNGKASADAGNRQEIKLTMPLKEFAAFVKKDNAPACLKTAFQAALTQSAALEKESKELQKLGFENCGPVTRKLIDIFDRTFGVLLEQVLTNTPGNPCTSIAIEDIEGYSGDATLTITKYDRLKALFCAQP